MPTFKLNPITGELDIINSNSDFDDRYVNISGDTMTGDLTLPTLYATSSGISEFFGGVQTTYLEALDAGYSEFYGGVIIKSGKKLILDG